MSKPANNRRRTRTWQISFLTGQPIWHLQINRESLTERAKDVIWESGVSENDPGDQDDWARNGAEFAEERFRMMQGMEGGQEAVSEKDKLFTWTRLASDEAREANRSADRGIMIDHAISEDANWKRVLLVCGAGYGKTTNLQWLAAKLNGKDHKDKSDNAEDYSQGKHFAICDELHTTIADIVDGNSSVVKYVAKKIESPGGFEDDEAESQANRLVSQGRITFLLDSLDQADRPKAIEAINALHKQAPECRIWISGRPYAFRETESQLRMMGDWQFLRIAPLEEAECRQLLEYHRVNWRQSSTADS